MANQKGDTVSTGHYFNRCVDTDKDTGEKKFETYSFWSMASDCEFDDGTTVQEKVNDISNRLCINDTNFVFDYQNGKYGYNTDSQRGADTFHPFSEIEKDKLLDALKYSGLDINTDNTPDEIYNTLRSIFRDRLRIWGRYDNTTNNNNDLITGDTTPAPTYEDYYYGEPVLYGNGTMEISTASLENRIPESHSTITYDTIVLSTETGCTLFVYFDEDIDSTLYTTLKICIEPPSLAEQDKPVEITYGLINSLPSDAAWNDWGKKASSTYSTNPTTGSIMGKPLLLDTDTVSLDISDCTGRCYIGIELSNCKSCRILEIELI